jgi:hypothetical protein
MMNQYDMIVKLLSKGLRLIPVTPVGDGYDTPLDYRKNPKVNWDSLICKNKTYQTFGCFHYAYYIIDIDVKNGKNGWETFFSTLLASINFMPEFVVVSKSGGAHLYFKSATAEIDQQKVEEEIKGTYLRKLNANYAKSGLDYKPNNWVRGPESEKTYTSKYTYHDLQTWIETNSDGSYFYTEITDQRALSAEEFLFLFFAAQEGGFDVSQGSRDTTAYTVAQKLAIWINPKISSENATSVMRLVHNTMPNHSSFDWDACIGKYEHARANQGALADKTKKYDASAEDEDVDQKQMMQNLNDKNYIHSLVRDNSWIECKYNEFSDEISVRIVDPNDPRSEWKLGEWDVLKDKHTDDLEKLITIHCGVKKKLHDHSVRTAIENKAHLNKFNPLKQYIESEEWDGVCRVESALHKYMNAYDDDDDYIRFASKSFFVSMIARAYDPGCKVDTMIVLEGPQKRGKSLFFKIIAKEWFTDSLGGIGTSEAYYNLRKFWIIEMAELATIRKSTIETVKSFLTKTDDSFRPAYGRNTVTYKRRNIFAGTTNESQYLVDPTGNRRFLPIKVRGLNKDALEKDVNQLLAEALVMYSNGVSWENHDNELEYIINKSQNERRERDDYLEDLLTDYINYNIDPTSIGVIVGKSREQPLTKVRVSDILDLYNGTLGSNKYIIEKKLGGILRERGYERKNIRVNGAKKWVFVKE